MRARTWSSTALGVLAVLLVVACESPVPSGTWHGPDEVAEPEPTPDVSYFALPATEPPTSLQRGSGSRSTRPLSSNAKGTQSDVRVRVERLYVERLYDELQGFKHDDDFRRVGFGVCCRYNQWLVAVEQLDARSGVEFLNEFGFVPSELVALAMQYKDGNYGGTYVTDLEKSVAAGLARTSAEPVVTPSRRVVIVRSTPRAKAEPQVTAGRGVTVRTDSACRTLAVTRRFFELLLAGEYARSQAVIDGPDCRRVHQGTPVRGPHETKTVVVNGERFVNYLGELPDGSRLWFGEGHVSWRR